MRRTRWIIIGASVAGLLGGIPACASAKCRTAELDRALRASLPPEALLQVIREVCTLPSGMQTAFRRFVESGGGALASVAGSLAEMIQWMPYVMSVCPGATRKLVRTARNVPADQAASDWLSACGLQRLAPDRASGVPLVRALVAAALYGWMAPQDPRRARAVAEHLLQARQRPGPARTYPSLRLPRLRRIPRMPRHAGEAGAAAAGPAPATRRAPRPGVGGISLVGPPPPPPRPEPRLVLLRPGMQRPVRVVDPAPSSLEKGRKARIEGKVRVVYVIGTDGRVESARAVDATPALAKACADAVRRWRFKPYLLDGRPVRLMVSRRFRFRLK